jgi:hypothetical protein
MSFILGSAKLGKIINISNNAQIYRQITTADFEALVDKMYRTYFGEVKTQNSGTQNTVNKKSQHTI